jgi:hypothetical protein
LLGKDVRLGQLGGSARHYGEMYTEDLDVGMSPSLLTATKARFESYGPSKCAVCVIIWRSREGGVALNQQWRRRQRGRWMVWQCAAGSSAERSREGPRAHGADVNAQGGKFGNALQAVLGRGRHNVVELLLGKGADVNAQGGDYGNTLQAASAEGHNKIVKLWLSAGADANVQGEDYGNALQAASYRRHNKLVEQVDCRARRFPNVCFLIESLFQGSRGLK